MNKHIPLDLQVLSEYLPEGFSLAKGSKIQLDLPDAWSSLEKELPATIAELRRSLLGCCELTASPEAEDEGLVLAYIFLDVDQLDLRFGRPPNKNPTTFPGNFLRSFYLLHNGWMDAENDFGIFSESMIEVLPKGKKVAWVVGRFGSDWLGLTEAGEGLAILTEEERIDLHTSFWPLADEFIRNSLNFMTTRAVGQMSGSR